MGAKRLIGDSHDVTPPVQTVSDIYHAYNAYGYTMNVLNRIERDRLTIAYETIYS